MTAPSMRSEQSALFSSLNPASWTNLRRGDIEFSAPPSGQDEGMGADGHAAVHNGP